MKQYEAVIITLERLGGQATLDYEALARDYEHEALKSTSDFTL